mmetsp:Transcript_95468/g.269813  ORF Transcript_95468/g.269813 Transcript_95468/m.269813 type:complete len:237 (-) Transcript_95468:122-832(-)
MDGGPPMRKALDLAQGRPQDATPVLRKVEYQGQAEPPTSRRAARLGQKQRPGTLAHGLPDVRTVLTERALARRAQERLEQTVSGLPLPKPSWEVVAESPRHPDAKLTLHCLTELARDEFLRQARLEAGAWLSSEEAKALEKRRRDAIDAELQGWYARRDTARCLEEERARAENEEKALAERRGRERWQRRGELLRQKLMAWHTQSEEHGAPTMTGMSGKAAVHQGSSRSKSTPRDG